MKGDHKMPKRSSFGNMVRRRLSDITNSMPQPKSPENMSPDTAAAKEFIDHLVKEKVALLKHIQEKNKIIELSGIEIKNLRTFLQKMQLQNWSLAQSNTHMLAELNLGKERLKALQHEIMCKEAVLKTKDLQLKGQEKAHSVEQKEFQHSLGLKEQDVNEDAKSCCVNRRHCLSRSRSLGSSTLSNHHAEKEAVRKRRCLRRQSANLRTRHEEPRDNFFEIDVLGSSVSDQGVLVDDSCVSGETRRTSIGRPLRKAAEKVQCYKERSINVKMRRPE